MLRRTTHLLVLVYLEILKVQTFCENKKKVHNVLLNREISALFSYLLIEIMKIKPREILSRQNREIEYP